MYHRSSCRLIDSQPHLPISRWQFNYECYKVQSINQNQTFQKVQEETFMVEETSGKQG